MVRINHPMFGNIQKKRKIIEDIPKCSDKTYIHNMVKEGSKTMEMFTDEYCTKCGWVRRSYTSRSFGGISTNKRPMWYPKQQPLKNVESKAARIRARIIELKNQLDNMGRLKE